MNTFFKQNKLTIILALLLMVLAVTMFIKWQADMNSALDKAYSSHLGYERIYEGFYRGRGNVKGSLLGSVFDIAEEDVLINDDDLLNISSLVDDGQKIYRRPVCGGYQIIAEDHIWLSNEKLIKAINVARYNGLVNSFGNLYYSEKDNCNI